MSMVFRERLITNNSNMEKRCQRETEQIPVKVPMPQRRQQAKTITTFFTTQIQGVYNALPNIKYGK